MRVETAVRDFGRKRLNVHFLIELIRGSMDDGLHLIMCFERVTDLDAQISQATMSIGMRTCSSTQSLQTNVVGQLNKLSSVSARMPGHRTSLKTTELAPRPVTKQIPLLVVDLRTIYNSAKQLT